VNIAGATSASYTLAGSDVGHTIVVRVTATNAGGSGSADSAATGVVSAAPPPPPSNTAVPVISGQAVQGQTLSASSGSWSNSPSSYAYQWLDCNSSGASCVNIAGASSQSYTLASSDVGHTIVVQVTATNAGGSASQSSAPTGVVQAAAVFPVKVSPNGRYLETAGGQPFLMLSDQLLPALHNGSLSDITTVLSDRQGRGYNGIWMALMPDSYIGASDTIQDQAGNYPFTCPGTCSGSPPSFNLPPTSGSGGASVDAYWTEVDSVVSAAAADGMQVLMMPVETAGVGMQVIRNWGTTGAFDYGEFLGNRYKNDPNIIWYDTNDFGGNSSWISGPPSQTDDTLMEQVVAGIKAAGDTHVQTAELNYSLSLSTDDSSSGGWRSIEDMNQAYTYFQTYDVMEKGYLGINSNDSLTQPQRYTPKPVFLGESNYEGANNVGGSACLAYCLRLQDYWTLLGGGLAGQVWGNKILHHFSSGWQTNLATEGAIEAGIWASFFRSIAFQNLVPDGLPDPTVAGNHTFVTSGYGTYDANADTDAINATNNTNGSLFTGTYATAALTPDGSLGVVYTPVTQGLVVNMAKMRGPVTARWFDPTTGNYTTIPGSPFTNSGSHTFTPSGSHSDGASDWVLVLTA
jgi:hypothetical protein